MDTDRLFLQIAIQHRFFSQEKAKKIWWLFLKAKEQSPSLSLFQFLKAQRLLSPDRLHALQRAFDSRIPTISSSLRETTFSQNPIPRMRFGNWRLLKRLGIGGMGEVWLAEHATLKKHAAVKLVLMGSLEKQQRFLREAKLLSKLQHPHIVQIYDFGKVPPYLYYAMEYIEGEDLARLVEREGPLRWTKALSFFHSLCLAVRAAHEAGIVHRDIKPENILIDKNKRVYLTDFGLAVAKDETRLTQAQTMAGTPCFMAPEQVTDFASASFPADLYGLGGVLFFMLTGKPPFEGEEVMQLLWQVVHKPPPSLQKLCPTVPKDLDEIVLRLLSKEPEQRGTIQELQEDIEHLQKGKRIRKTSFSKKRLGFIATLSALLLLLPSWLLFKKSPPQKKANPSSSKKEIVASLPIQKLEKQLKQWWKELKTSPPPIRAAKIAERTIGFLKLEAQNKTVLSNSLLAILKLYKIPKTAKELKQNWAQLLFCLHLAHWGISQKMDLTSYLSSLLKNLYPAYQESLYFSFQNSLSGDLKQTLLEEHLKQVLQKLSHVVLKTEKPSLVARLFPYLYFCQMDKKYAKEVGKKLAQKLKQTSLDLSQWEKLKNPSLVGDFLLFFSYIYRYTKGVTPKVLKEAAEKAQKKWGTFPAFLLIQASYYIRQKKSEKVIQLIQSLPFSSSPYTLALYRTKLRYFFLRKQWGTIHKEIEPYFKLSRDSQTVLALHLSQTFSLLLHIYQHMDKKFFFSYEEKLKKLALLFPKLYQSSLRQLYQRYIQRLQKRIQENRTRYHFYIRLGRLYALSGQYQKALKSLQAASQQLFGKFSRSENSLKKHLQYEQYLLHYLSRSFKGKLRRQNRSCEYCQYYWICIYQWGIQRKVFNVLQKAREKCRNKLIRLALIQVEILSEKKGD